jgi:hypothetical protein
VEFPIHNERWKIWVIVRIRISGRIYPYDLEVSNVIFNPLTPFDNVASMQIFISPEDDGSSLLENFSFVGFVNIRGCKAESEKGRMKSDFNNWVGNKISFEYDGWCNPNIVPVYPSGMIVHAKGRQC